MEVDPGYQRGLRASDDRFQRVPVVVRMGDGRKLRPQLAVLSVEYSSVGDVSQATETGLRDELTALKQRSPRVVLVQDTPHLQKDPTDCLLANGATLGSCT